MVVKTDLCAYTEYKIYPGRGMKFVGRDGKIHFFLSKKADSLFHQKIKAAKLTWSQAWRRNNPHKKGKEAGAKKTKKKATKFQKAIAGMSLDEIMRRKAQRSEFRNKAIEEAKADARKRIQNKPKGGAAKPAGGAQKKQQAPAQKNMKQKAAQGGKQNKR